MYIYGSPVFIFSQMAMRQKNKDPERWLLQKRNGQGPSSATTALLKAEPLDASIGGNFGQSLGPGGRRLRTVVNEDGGLFGDEDEDGGSRRRNLGQDADYDEVPYHEDFADDEEKVVPDDHQEDEIEKEMEVSTALHFVIRADLRQERISREYMGANKSRPTGVDESDEEEHDPALTGAGKAIKKLMDKHEKNDAYESDNDGEDPYVSSAVRLCSFALRNNLTDLVGGRRGRRASNYRWTSCPATIHAFACLHK
jgi:transcription initiation factor TFIIF subunit alpha